MQKLMIYTIPAMIAGGLLALILIIINQATGHIETYGKPYPYTSSYCAYHGGTAKAPVCLRYETTTEMRIGTHVTGFLFDFDSYKVVDKTK